MAGEFALIDKYFARPTPSAVLGPGDDCALLQPSPGMQLAVTTDMLVAGTHFFPDTDPGNLGWKALAVNVSDLAAMGAAPRWALLAGSLPEAAEAWIGAFAEGFFACAAEYGVEVVGGDTTRGPLNLCITAMGEVAPGQALRRDGAKAGDDIWVSGRPGDDCALLQPSPGMQLAVTTDMLVAGTHFFPDTDPRNLGWKALAVNVSDLAAMGAAPRWALLAGSLPEAAEAWIGAFAEGFFACAAEYGIEVVGGDTTRGPLNLCITAMGEVAPGQALRRDGAKAGDDIWVSGRPGLAGLGLAHLKGKVELPEPWRRLCLSALEKPKPRVSLGRALVGVANAAIDVSDGLLADLGHIAERSALAAVVQLVQLPHLPKGIDRALALDCQLAGGDDYELCFTAAPGQRLAIGRIAADLELPLWCIGTMQAPGAAFTLEDWNAVAEGTGSVTVYDPDGKPIAFDRKGYDHFG